MPIPRILHQLWIGEKPMPSKFMDTWKDKHPGFEYIRWTEAEIAKRGITFVCQKAIDDMSEINGKADIMRWELLYRFGGVFMDADSICIEPIDELVTNNVTAFAGYENEQVRPGLIATGTMGFTPQHPLCRDAIQWILANDVSVERTGHRAWKSVGPGLLTRLYDANKTNYGTGFTIHPSYFFLPIHHTGLLYNGHAKVYAYQEWGSTKQNYEVMNQVDLPRMFLPPETWVSILICSYNTPRKYIKECLQSIAQQRGHFGMEVVWINDGSSEPFTAELKEEIHSFVNTTRFIRVVYKKIKKVAAGYNPPGACMNRGLALCKHELVIRMDSDDIMLPDRIQKQLDFFRENPDCVVCGANVGYLHTNMTTGKYEIRGQTNHPPAMTWTTFMETKPLWFMNNPTLCYKKSAVLEVGGYDESPDATEDWMLEVALMKRFGSVHNLPEVLLYYRIHPGQLTFQGKFNTPARMAAKEAFLRKIIE